MTIKGHTAKTVLKHALLALVLCVAISLTASDAYPDHNPPRPQVSYDCDRYALLFNHDTNRWECVEGSRVKENEETLGRIKKLKKEVEARIRKLQRQTQKLKQEQQRRLRQLINQQRQLTRALQQN